MSRLAALALLCAAAAPAAASASTHRVVDGDWSGLLFTLLLGVVALAYWTRRQEQRSRRRARQDQVSDAVRVAEDDDPAFATTPVMDRARELVEGVTTAWGQGDAARLEPLVAPALLARWTQELRRGTGRYADLRFTRPAELHYVGLANRARDTEDRVTVHVSRVAEETLTAPTPIVIGPQRERTRALRLDEYWTLAKHDGRWLVHAVETEQEGARHLEARLDLTPDRAPSPSADATPVGAEAATFDLPAWDAVQRLAAGDERFAARRVAAAVQATAQAWVRALADAPGAELPADVSDALQQRDHVAGARLMVRHAQVRGIRIAAVDEDRSPPRVVARLSVRGLRWTQDPHTDAVIAGDREHEVDFTERWTFGATDDPQRPWRLEHVDAPGDV